MTYFVIYIVILVLIGLFDSRKIKTFDDYIVAGRDKSGLLVFFSLVASCLGASATIGIVSLACKIGFPAVWWLVSGGIGLILSGLLFAGKLQQGGFYTLPDFVGRVIGGRVKKLVAVTILVAWLGIVAAQFVAVSVILKLFFSGSINSLIVLAAVCICVYTYLGGQISILRTDFLQGNLIILTVLFFAGLLFFNNSSSVGYADMVFVNDSFPISRIGFFFLAVGSTYLIGPDIFSRIFTAKDAKTAKIACVSAGGILIVISFLIVFLGVWAKNNGFSSSNTLVSLLTTVVPANIGYLFVLGFLSAVISSADTCLLTMSAIVEKDLFNGKSLKAARKMIFLIGGLALCLALWKQDIIGLLISGYKVFSAGVIPVLFVALFVFPKYKVNQMLAGAGILVGGMLGCLAVFFARDIFVVYGVIISVCLALIGVRVKKGRF